MGLEWLYFIGAIVLLAALAYGTMQVRNRSRRADDIGEAVTRKRYENDQT